MTTRPIHTAASRRHRPALRLCAAAVLAAMLGACAAEVNIRGNQLDEEAFALLKPGQQNREQVIELLGSPTAVATFDSNLIYYITQRTRTVTYHSPEVLSRTVVAIHFGDDGRISEIKTLGLDDGKEVQLVDRTTPTPGRQFSLMQQLLGNLGRFESNEETRAQ